MNGSSEKMELVDDRDEKIKGCWLIVRNDAMIPESAIKAAEEIDVMFGNVCECGHHENRHARIGPVVSHPCFVKGCECREYDPKLESEKERLSKMIGRFYTYE
jgi:hypothetical protein